MHPNEVRLETRRQAFFVAIEQLMEQNPPRLDVPCNEQKAEKFLRKIRNRRKNLLERIRLDVWHFTVNAHATKGSSIAALAESRDRQYTASQLDPGQVEAIRAMLYD